MDARSDPAPSATSDPPSGPRPTTPIVHPDPVQRWRLTVARASDASTLNQRDTTAAWEAAIRSSGLPFAPVALATPGKDSARPPAAERPRLSFGAALPSGMPAEAELLDVLLSERLPRWRVREALVPAMPDGWRLIDLEDVWLGGAAVAGLVAGADYRVSVTSDASSSAISDACRALLAAAALPRQREKGGGLVAYDLRPLLLDVAMTQAGPPIVLRIRTRIHPSLGSGRPEEVVAAIAAAVGRPVVPSSMVRERLLLGDDLESEPAFD